MLNITHIDFFSLDVEGLEEAILKTIQFDKITIDILSVEYKTSFSDVPEHEAKARIQQALASTHQAISTIHTDIIFVRKELILHKSIQVED